MNGFDNTASDIVPLPFAFTARMRVAYTRPFTSPDTTIGEVVTGVEGVTHVAPSSVEYW